MRIKLTVAYIGTNYKGYQSQPHRNTVQDKLEEALSRYFGGQFTRVYAAGRTDVGVHAGGQVVHFDTDKEVNCYKLCLGVNLYLPSDISLIDAEVVSDSFDARFGASSKTYCYRMYISSNRIPLMDINHAQVYKPLDVDKMVSASKLLVGTHDYNAFQNSGSTLKGTVRTINSLTVSQEGNVISLTINGNAFLYNMVRLIAGTLLLVGQGKLTEQHIELLLSSHSRKSINMLTMPSCGLTLEKVLYQ